MAHLIFLKFVNNVLRSLSFPFISISFLSILTELDCNLMLKTSNVYRFFVSWIYKSKLLLRKRLCEDLTGVPLGVTKETCY